GSGGGGGNGGVSGGSVGGVGGVVNTGGAGGGESSAGGGGGGSTAAAPWIDPTEATAGVTPVPGGAPGTTSMGAPAEGMQPEPMEPAGKPDGQ
ncbi:MAG TPA: hypothetical protein VNN06_01385, partial [Ramlibacter sp.]|nr:hypothetical protein [Ramlibacter sp.]